MLFLKTALGRTRSRIHPSKHSRTTQTPNPHPTHSYLLIQLPAFVYAGRDNTTAELARDERPWALVGLLTSLISFVLYLLYQFRNAGSDEVKNDKIAEIALKKCVARRGDRA